MGSLRGDALQVEDPLGVAAAAGRPGTGDDKSPHDGRLAAAVAAVEADDDAVVLVRSHRLSRLCDVEQSVVHLEGEGRRVREHVTEHDGRIAARLHVERTLWIERHERCQSAVSQRHGPFHMDALSFV